MTLTQASNDTKWSVNSVRLQPPNMINTNSYNIENINLAGKSTFILGSVGPSGSNNDFITGQYNKIRLENNSSLTGTPKPDGVGNTWNLYEISIQDLNGTNYSITNFKDKYGSNFNRISILRRLVDSNDNTYWTYNTNDTDLDGSPDQNVIGKQWLEFEVYVSKKYF